MSFRIASSAATLRILALLVTVSYAAVPLSASPPQAAAGPAVETDTSRSTPPLRALPSVAGIEAEPFYKVIAQPGELDTSREGITLWHDYGAFALYRVSPVALNQLQDSGRRSILVSTDMDDILLDAYPFNTQADSFDAIPELLRVTEPDGAAVQLVQFVGPIQDGWLQAVREAGATPIHYIANYGYLVWADEEARMLLDEMVRAGDFLQFSAPYQPYFKLGGSLGERALGIGDPGEVVTATIQMYDHAGKGATERSIAELVLEQQSPWTPILDYQNVVATVRAGDLAAIAALPDVVWIGEYEKNELHDEVQDQILAANFNGGLSGPSGPGYLDWLTSYGFSTDPADYPIVDVTDDGIGNGTINSGDYTLHREGSIANTTRLQYVGNCTGLLDGSGLGGHGHINVSIVGGYDTLTGFPHQDAAGFNRGLGVNPYARLAGTRVFDHYGFDLSRCGDAYTGLIKQVQDSGAQIASNSWGCTLCAGSYNTASQAFDVGVRDADLTQPGNQELVFIFSAGNSGPLTGTVGTPGNGKNIITVGASENYRPSDEDGSWWDGCGTGPTGADNAMDVMGRSSRGPAPGGRVKPELIAPGTHIQGTASTDEYYEGDGVCDEYRPSGQSVFAASSGTSHSTPAVAGVASLYYYWLENEYGVTPSPALMKAYLIAHPTYLTGQYANDTLPSNVQGYGMPNMTLAFDDTPRHMINQTELFDNSGETWSFSGSIADAGKPVRVVLAYTDEPGATGTSPEVNDLNLEVTVGGTTYLGNNFSGQWSVSGGSADDDNNYEAVFLPAGTTGQISVSITAFNIAGDGVPGTGDSTDQDFALVVYNVSLEPAGYLDGTISDSSTTDPIVGANVQAAGLVPANDRSTASGAAGYYRRWLPTDTYTVTAAAYGYHTAEISGVPILSGTTTTLDIPLTPAAMYLVEGTVTDAATGWPLYAAVDILGYPGGTVWTDPLSGFYSVTLPGGTAFDFNVSAWDDGYKDATVSVGPLTGASTEDFALAVDPVTCGALGYSCSPGDEVYSEDFEASDGGYTTSGTTSWAWGEPTSGPGGAHSGTRVWATNLTGDYSNDEDGYLTSPDVDLSAHAGQSFSLSWWQWYDGVDCCDYISVEVSANGGGGWTLVYGELDGYDINEGAWEQQAVLLDSSHAVEDFRVRFRFRSDSTFTDPGWYVDDVVVAKMACSPQGGGLVVGNVYDEETSAPLVGATVLNDNGYSTTAAATADPAVDDAFYTLFSPTGSHAFTATIGGDYAPDTGIVTVVPSDTVRQDFFLPIGDGLADWVLTGEGVLDDFGYSVATAGDVNGDGYSDVVVGARIYDDWRGRIYVYTGGPDGLSATPIFTATGEETHSQLGHSVATAGDVNGDGYDDIVVSARDYGVAHGRVYVYAGGPEGITEPPIFTATGEGMVDEFGSSVATAGDVNGDGYDDVIVGSKRYNDYQGRVYVYAGGPDGLSAPPIFTATGEGTDYLGKSVASAGDVNGDGYDDIVLGAYGHNDYRGRVYVYVGGPSGLSATPIFTASGQSSIGWAGDHVGYSVATAGDVNGDGYADIIVGADGYNFHDYRAQGQAYVYGGGPAGLSATPIFTATGEAWGDFFGNSVATAGDVNGDGYSDIVVGAHCYHGGDYSRALGRAYVYAGGAAGLSPTPILTATGEYTETHNFLGSSVATAGDVNGDGYSEVVVGAPGYNLAQGRVYVFAGKADAPSSTPIFTATGETTDNYFGDSVATAGDVNGDGYADMVVGARGYNSNQGRVYVYTGGTGGLSATSVFTATGEDTSNYYSDSVAVAGDVNGDGYGDLIVGARGYNWSQGRAYVYAGGDSGLSATPIFTATGEDTSHHFGVSVATAGDVNGDGYSDVVVGAYGYDAFRGRAYVYAGGDGGLSATPIFTASGEVSGDIFGAVVAPAGDVNGDGYADLIVSAWGYGGGRGRAYVYAGEADGVATTPIFTATGEGMNDFFGFSVAAAGDVNRDGYGEIVVGAPEHDELGRAYVYAGGAEGIAETPVFTATGAAMYNLFGQSVGTAGDVNGDGFADVVVGAPGHDFMTGRVYVYVGGAEGIAETPIYTFTGESAGIAFGDSVSAAGDVNGDGYADIAVGAHTYGGSQGRAYVYRGNGSEGRLVLARQATGGGATPVQPWGDAGSAFLVQLNATSPLGRERVKLQIEACPPGVAFGDEFCAIQTSSWTDVTTATTGIPLETVVLARGLDGLVRWRARVLYDSPLTIQGPWRRFLGQALEADIRVESERVCLPLVLRSY